MNDSVVKKLIEYYQQKLKLMQEILQLSRRMTVSSEFDQLEKHLMARQEYMNKVDQWDQQIQLLKDKLVAETGAAHWADFKKQQPEVLQQLEPIIAAIGAAAKEAKELADQSRAEAEQRLKELQLEMRKMQSSKVGMKAYHNKPKQHSGYFLDKKK
ncbi:hypothetical protein V6C27_13085 [Peptococcaceae bacterium 1198_IL3148]